MKADFFAVVKKFLEQLGRRRPDRRSLAFTTLPSAQAAELARVPWREAVRILEVHSYEVPEVLAVPVE